MSLLEDWQLQETGQLAYETDGLGSSSDFRRSDTLDAREPGSPSASTEAPIFSLEVVERNVSRGRGQVTAAVAANNAVAVITSRGWFLRYDLAQGPMPVIELELTKTPDTEATGLWTDPSGNHFIITARSPTGCESFYLHSRWKKTRPLTRLKGLHLTALAWQLDAVTETSTGEIAIGTDSGIVFSIACDEKEKKERGRKVVVDLSSLDQPVRGLAQLPLPEEKLLLLLSTPSRLYAFCGATGLEAIAAGYPPAAGLSNFVELPPGPQSGMLSCHRSPGAVQAKRFAWLAGPGLYRGGLDLASAHLPPAELDHLTEHNLLPLPLSRGFDERPTAAAQTEYHELLLYKSRLQAVNCVSQALVQELTLPGRTGGSGSSADPLGFAEDSSSGSVFLFTADSIIEIVPRDEERDMWRVYLERNDFVNAFRRCRTQAHRDAVNDAEGSLAFGEGRYLAAAKLWGRVTSPPPSFEEVALKFVELGEPDVLQAFLMTKLDTLAPNDKAQATMVATWLTELHLDRVNRALLKAGVLNADSPDVRTLAEELRGFLRQHVDLLDVRTTVTLLASYGRLDDLMEYAMYRQDNEAVLDYLVSRGDAARALAVLRRPGVSQELVYKFSPSLMALAPSEAVDAWMAASPALEPRRLLPALLRCAEEGSAPACRAHALRYVRFCIQGQQSEDPSIHQLAVALYSSDGDEAALMSYLDSARDLLGNPLYDAQAALQAARRHGLRRASVELLWQLKLYEDAVNLALQFDMQQATLLASRPQEDEALQRKLWLAIACHLIQSAVPRADGAPGESIKKINDLIREAGGLIKIEDVLPLFPDFVQIDNFKEAICQSLDDYNKQISGLKSEMDEATRIADALRKDVAMLEHRRATLNLAEPCARCNRPVGEAPPASAGPSGGAVPRFFLFPTGNAFHGSCLAREVISLSAPPQQQRIETLLAALAKASDGGSDFGISGGAAMPEGIRKMQAQLKAEIAAEDPFNGEIVIRNIDMPFVLPTEQDEIESWKI